MMVAAWRYDTREMGIGMDLSVKGAQNPESDISRAGFS